MKTLLESYLTHLKAEGKSPHTINSYRRQISAFILEVDKPAGDVSPNDVALYVASLRNAGKSPSTVNQAASALKAFFTWANDAGHVNVSPCRSIKTKRVQSLPKNIPTDLDKKRLMRELRQSADPLALRDRAMIHMMFATGVRLEELVNLNLDSFDDEKHLRVMGKGSKERVIPLGASIRGTLRLYLRERKKASTDSPALFLARGRISKGSVQDRLAYWCRKAEIRAYSPHCLRHKCATDVIGISGNLLYAKKLLGHSRIETTMIYLQLADEEFDDLMENF